MFQKNDQIVEFIDTVYLPVLNKQESIQWFQEKLGLQWNGHCFNLGSGPVIFLVQVKNKDDVKISYLTDDWEGIDYEMQLVTFRSKNIDETYKILKERGVRVSEVRMYDGNRKNFRFYDLNGNRFDVWSGWL
ncbi:VOC family protein [Cohnella pontilimi]|uniref:VOC family protein n=1 Tax=Cohnella pontilimi TaxID=2564100 RepID=A0A4U0FG52_9BACL|nr:VOC family protein [Cohnella pontilimi]TJY43848.1 VOC family protein [Cohnella pontilimi]